MSLKNIIFLSQLLENNNRYLMKWKHFLIKNDLNLKGKVPRWFKRIEEVIIEDHLTRKIKDKYIESEKNSKEIHIKLYDEDEKINKNDVISWINNQGFPIFGMDKKKSRSKNFKRIGYHMKIKDEEGGVDIDNSPELVRCEEDKGRKITEYKVGIVIRENLYSEKEEIKFSFIYDVRIENEFRILLRALILSLLLIDKQSEVILGIDKHIIQIIKNFNNNSNRRNLDEDLYLELSFIEKYMEKMKFKFNDDDELYLELKKINQSLREELKNEKKLKNLKIYKLNFVDEVMSFDEFNLYWKNMIIKVDIIEWQKKCSDLIWKNEILNSKKLEDLFYDYNYRGEFDWNKTLKFISNRNNMGLEK
ncbi:hypothetical protein C1646_666821 [Rhizophagus diaphanus]|nr:hypothetical protein C1646_666821 [Rhizophagus diaphanus] [Rhizophagus sp. MUCL 43196]